MARLGPEFWDTRVLLDWVLRSDGSKPAEVHYGILNVFEAVQNLIEDAGMPLARQAVQMLLPWAEPLTERRILGASNLRIRERHRGLSYADAAGYITARELGAVFVTTDSGFKGLPGTKIVPPAP